jgi:hypothetical protein
MFEVGCALGLRMRARAIAAAPARCRRPAAPSRLTPPTHPSTRPYQVEIVVPPKESLGIYALPPLTHNGEQIEIDGQGYIVTSLVLKYKLVKGGLLSVLLGPACCCGLPAAAGARLVLLGGRQRWAWPAAAGLLAGGLDCAPLAEPCRGAAALGSPA